MNTSKNKALARKCIDRLTHYAAERRLGFEACQVGNIGIDPEAREERSRKLIRELAEYYGFGEEAQALADRFDERLNDARRSFGIETLSVAEQRETVAFLLGYAHAMAGDRISSEHKDSREQMLTVRDHFEDMASCLSWDISAIKLNEARDWLDRALPKLTTWEDIVFTRILLGSEGGANSSDFVGGSVTDAKTVAATELFIKMTSDYPKVQEWPAVCTVYRCGFEAPRDASKLDLEIMRRYEDAFLRLPGVQVCRLPEQISVPRELRPTTDSAELDAKVEQKLAEYAASEAFNFDCGHLELEYRREGKPVPGPEELKAEVMAGARDTIRFNLECEAAGHEFVDHADAENGRGSVECERCGFSWDYQW